MPRSKLARRLITVPTVIVGLVATTALLPAALPIGLAIDVARAAFAKRPFMTVRIVVLLWVYLLGEVWATVALGVVSVLPEPSRLDAAYRLQVAWTAWNLQAVKRIFGLTVEVEGSDCVVPGPVLVLSRHASAIDTLLPAQFVTRRHGIRLRYVLKKELLIDPALDIAGTRLPNYFVDRGSGESERELKAIRDLARELTPNEGVLIYPEGTRFSQEKLEGIKRRHAVKSSEVSEFTMSFRNVLPPRPGGTLALLEATTADIVLLAHCGLEGFAGVRDIWDGKLVGTSVTARMWRIARSDIPFGRSEQVRWLFETWQLIDDAVEAGC